MTNTSEPIDRDEKYALETALQPLFNKIFGTAPTSGQFAFRRDPEWPKYAAEIATKQHILRGVWICRTIGSGSWFPVYHYMDQNPNEDLLCNQAGIKYYSYWKPDQ